MPKDAAVEEFARLVRALKARDGRSYEALGRRLNVSASTLHRYCSAATVPEDFAVVDRLAVLCGADAEQRRTLEEAWALADRARRPPAPEPEPAPEPRPAADPASEPARASDPACGSGPVSGPAGARLPVPVSAAGPVRQPEDGPEATAAVAGDAPRRLPSGPGRRRWWRVGLVLGALAVVGAVTLGAVLLDGRSGEREAPAAPAVPPPPLTWTVASHIWTNGCGHTYLAERSPGPPPEAADARSWAASRGAVHGGEMLVRLSVQGKGTAAVVLQGLHVRVVGRGTPLPWTGYRMDDGCGGAVTPRRFEVDLDRPRPVARALDGYDASGQEGRTIPAVSFPYKVTAAEPEELLVFARTADCDCRWYLELEWSSEGRSGTTRITDEEGRPFRISGTAGGTVAYDTAKGRWITVSESGQSG
ncbi:helix-turn-helix domain-containing protein [Streptomyces sp. NPDC101115]|uniref:helix-turn-helix domain-containing protein n=1 Tax=Streptomyces sp. NPDC101115 TaxID=3366106 RepID=UPI0038259B53